MIWCELADFWVFISYLSPQLIIIDYNEFQVNEVKKHFTTHLDS